MKRQLLRFAPWVALMVVGVVSTPRPANPEPQPRTHPRIRAAIDSVRDAQEYLRTAPNDFCGHKAEAMRAAEATIRQLQLALECRR